jgi:enoyl-CoA hydratase/carnithine racemase
MTESTEDVLRSALGDGVLVLTMNRPDKRNALNLALIEALIAALEEADKSAAARAIVLTGAGPAFCAGADMKEFADAEARASAPSVRRSDLMSRLFGMIPAMTTPVIAAVNGFALGGGCALMLGCDMAVAADGASFGYPELRHGMAAGGVMPSLVRLVGTRTAFDLVATARTLDADEALRLNLVNRVVAAEGLIDEAISIAAVLAGYPPGAVATTKRVLHETATLSVVDGLAHAGALRRD